MAICASSAGWSAGSGGCEMARRNPNRPIRWLTEPATGRRFWYLNDVCDALRLDTNIWRRKLPDDEVVDIRATGEPLRPGRARFGRELAVTAKGLVRMAMASSSVNAIAWQETVISGLAAKPKEVERLFGRLARGKVVLPGRNQPVSLEEVREWLRRIEAGETKLAIARDVGRNRSVIEDYTNPAKAPAFVKRALWP